MLDQASKAAITCGHEHGDHEHEHRHSSSTNLVTPLTISEGAASAIFLIQKMDCPTEERLIRDKLEGIAGNEALSFNLYARYSPTRRAADSAISRSQLA